MELFISMWAMNLLYPVNITKKILKSVRLLLLRDVKYPTAESTLSPGV